MKRGNKTPSNEAGLTAHSLSVIVFAMLLTAIMLILGETVIGQGFHYSMHAFAIPAAAVFLALSAAAFAFHRFRGIRLLTRAEMTCVFFTLLIAAPIMGLGFWTHFIWVSSTFAVQGDFEKLDMVSDRLWPHGPNLLEGQLRGPAGVDTDGKVQWVETEYEEGLTAVIPKLECGPGENAVVRVKVPLEKNGHAFLTLDQRYILSVLVRAADLGPETTVYGRVYYDDTRPFALEAFSNRPACRPTVVHKKGFERVGVYGVEFSPKVNEFIDVEFRLDGEGVLELADPKLMNVEAYESLFRGRRTATEAEYASLRKSEQPAFVMLPDRLFSLAGVKYLLCGFVPVQYWATPVLTWLAFILLLLTATFSLALILRRQWVKNERYGMPLAQIPMTILGINQPGCEDGTPSPIWRNRVMWLGFAISLFWCLMRCWHVYNISVPEMSVDVQLKPYLSDPSWGRMWNYVSFSISAMALSLAVFMELNVLMSLIIGFFLFQSLHWVGEATGWAIGTEGRVGMGVYPYEDEQLMGAYLAYGALTLFFTRKYIWKTIRQAIKGGRQLDRSETDVAHNGDEQEPLSYRTAYLMLIASFAGAVVWGVWAEVGAVPMAVLFATMVMVGFVAMKLRAECGTPVGWIGVGARVIVPLVGGMTFLGARGAMFASWTTVGMVLLFVIPGLQFEFIEVARRIRIKSRHLVYCVLLGVCGGMLVGGWVFLSTLYGIGSDSAFQVQWFQARPWEFFADGEMQRVADSQLEQNMEGTVAAAGAEEAKADEPWMKPENWGFVGAAAATAIVTILRQVFSGFWFHPIGIVLAATADGFGMLRYWDFNLWGSLLAAWCIRFAVLKIGGAAAVRNYLFPFFVGVFIAAISAEVVFFGVNAYYYYFQQSVARVGIVL